MLQFVPVFEHFTIRIEFFLCWFSMNLISISRSFETLAMFQRPSFTCRAGADGSSLLVALQNRLLLLSLLLFILLFYSFHKALLLNILWIFSIHKCQPEPDLKPVGKQFIFSICGNSDILKYISNTLFSD